MNAAGSQQISQADIAVGEFKGMMDTFAKLQSISYQRCVASVADPSLQVGEQSCTDRCVSKYMDVRSNVFS